MEDTLEMSPATDIAERILVVDDDPGIRDVVSDFLGKHGYAVETAADGEEMEQALERGARRPDRAGRHAARRGRPGDLPPAGRGRTAPPIIMLSAMGEDTDRIVGLELGADDYLAKPCNPRELLARVRAVLRRAEQRSARRRGRRRLRVRRLAAGPGAPRTALPAGRGGEPLLR